MTEEDTGGNLAESDPGQGLVAEVAALDEELAAEVAAVCEQRATLEAELRERETELEELTERLKRTQADFQNYKKRTERQLEEAREQATADLVERLLEVRDNLERALDQDESADIRDGVEATRRVFDDVLAAENVERIEPTPGEKLDPQRHEALQRVEADHPEGTVADVYRPGYEMADTVLRPAQVTVADGA